MAFFLLLLKNSPFTHQIPVFWDLPEGLLLIWVKVSRQSMKGKIKRKKSIVWFSFLKMKKNCCKKWLKSKTSLPSVLSSDASPMKAKPEKDSNSCKRSEKTSDNPTIWPHQLCYWTFKYPAKKLTPSTTTVFTRMKNKKKTHWETLWWILWTFFQWQGQSHKTKLMTWSTTVWQDWFICAVKDCCHPSRKYSKWWQWLRANRKK